MSNIKTKELPKQEIAKVENFSITKDFSPEIIKLRQMTGEGYRLALPLCVFNSDIGTDNSGKYVLYTGEKDAEGKSVKKFIDAGFEAFIVGSRYQINNYDPKDETKTFKSKEFTSLKEEVEVKNQDGTLICTSSYSAGKEMYGFRLSVNLYLHLKNGGAMKLSIKGMNYSEYISFCNSFDKNDSMSLWLIKFGAKTKIDGTGKTRPVIDFQKVERIKTVEQAIADNEAVRLAWTMLDAQYEESVKTQEVKEPIEVITEAAVPNFE